MNVFSNSKVRSAQGIWQSAVKRRSLLVGRLIRAIPLIVGSSSTGWLKAVHCFVKFALEIRKHQGDRGLAIHLKASSLIFMRALAGHRLENPRLAGAAVSLSSSGYPRWIPCQMRLRVLQGDRKVIRFYLGLCTLSRVLPFRGPLTIKSIVEPGVPISKDWLRSWVCFVRDVFIPYLVKFGYKRQYGKVDLGENPGVFFPILKGKLLALFTSGPNSSWSNRLAVGSFLQDAISIRDRPSLHMVMLNFARWGNNMNIMHSPVWSLALGAFQFEWCKHHSKNAGVPQGKVGKLGIREEPGKMRVFAVVDSFTQSLLRPLHDHIFSILKLIPQDGTFNQASPMKGLIKYLKENNQNHCWSYDLSAATDRLPVKIQELVLGLLFQPRFASQWRALLCDRSFELPSLMVKTWGKAKAFVKYAVGQPMGAYSSWGMLALTHHALVQFAAYKAGYRTWFTGYAILGDDVAIGHRHVAEQYVLLMKELGVGISFHKSIVSNNRSLEFAKRFVYKGEEVTPLPLLAIACGWLGVSAVPEVIRAAEGLGGFVLSSFQIGKFIGMGMRVSSKLGTTLVTKLPRRARSLLILLTHPGAPRASPDLWSWLRLKTFGSDVLVPSHKSKELVAHLIHWVDDIRWPSLQRTLSEHLNGLVPKTMSNDDEHSEEYLEWFKLNVHLPLVQKFRWQGMMIENKIREIRELDSIDETQINELLDLVDSFESDLAAIPAEITGQRRESEKSVAPMFRSKVVSYWTRLGEFIARPTNRSIRRKTAWKETFESSDIMRLL